MRKWIDSLYKSFFNNEEGFSGRKLTAFTLVLCIITLHIIFVTKRDDIFKDLLIDILIIDVCGVAFFQGLVTVGNLIELRTGNVIEPDGNKNENGNGV